MSLVVHFDWPCARPTRFPSPFATTPHPLARHAADLMIARLPSLDEGKMFGVLVVEDRDGRIGYLAAFSGMLAGSWHAEGFVPPLFDEVARDSWWPAAEAELAAIAARIAALDASPRDELAALDAAHAAALDALLARHRKNREQRRMTRAELARPDLRRLDMPRSDLPRPDIPRSDLPHPDVARSDIPRPDFPRPDSDARALHALDQASRGDSAEKRRMLDARVASREPLARAVAVLDAEQRALEDLRAAKSRHYLHGLFDTYALANGRGERIRLRELFAPDEPPGGAGDCAAPKLLGYAFREGLRPIALAEVWWGPPPLAGGRHHGLFYPACRGKCGPLLGHMLDGLDVEPAPEFAAAIDASAPGIVFEDQWLVIVDKPPGLLSVVGRALRDSVQTRLAERFGEAHVVHRLDLDASGLLVVAKQRATYVELQRLFAARQIEKRYVAWLDGVPRAAEGMVDLPLCVDPYDRPRQVVDPTHGKPALTEWRAVGTARGRTRVELFPRTGRTHQLRVHAAHPRGIGVPLVGDRLYGRHGPRLLLDAEWISFVHPHTKARVIAERAAPF